MKIQETRCRTALSKSTLPSLDYSLNPYRGCQHACAYCYVPNVLRIPRNIWGKFVEARVNIPTILSKELKQKQKGVIGLSTVTDPYQPVEKKYNLTRYCLEQLIQYDFPVSIQTKSSMVLKDSDLISKFSDIEVGITITTLDDNERKILEPFSSSVDERLDVLKQLSETGIKTYVFFGPIYPTLEREQIPIIVETLASYGVSEIMIDKFNLKPGVWQSIEKSLLKHPQLKKLFTERLFNNRTYYNIIYKEIFQIGKKMGIAVKLAFANGS